MTKKSIPFFQNIDLKTQNIHVFVMLKQEQLVDTKLVRLAFAQKKNDLNLHTLKYVLLLSKNSKRSHPKTYYNLLINR